MMFKKIIFVICVMSSAIMVNADDVPSVVSDDSSFSSGSSASASGYYSGGVGNNSAGMSQQSGYANSSSGYGSSANGNQSQQGMNANIASQIVAGTNTAIRGGMQQGGSNDQSQYRRQILGINDYGLANANQRYNLPFSAIDSFANSVFLRTGLHLDRYGYNLFQNPGSFIAADNVPASSNYVLGPGDAIEIRTWGALDLDLQTTIDKEGGIVIPKVGRVSLTGIKVADLDKYLKSKLRKSYRNFSVSSTVLHLRSIQVTVAGFAISPGTFTVSSLSTLTDAVFASGGPSPQGSLRHIELKRGGVVIADYDMYKLLINGNADSDVRLAPGDVIEIKPHGNEVAIYDGVKSPGIYETLNNETIADVVNYAGGYTFNNKKQKIIVETMDKNQKINVLEYPFVSGLNQKVNDGDIIHFFTAANHYEKTVSLIGSVAYPTRMPWHQGMRVRDLIPNKEALLTKTFWNSYNYNTYAMDNQASIMGREKTDNWSQVSNSGDSGDIQYAGGLSNDSSDASAKATGNNGQFNAGDNLFVAGPIAIPEADINWHYAVIVRVDPTNFRSSLIPFDLMSAINGDVKNNLELQPGDVINVLSTKDVVNPARKGRLYVFIDGEVNNPGVYELQPGSTLLDAISVAKGLTPDAYLYGLVLSRQEVKKQQKASLDQMLDQMQQSLLGQAANTAAITNANAPGATGIVVSQQQALIDKLRTMQPTGRIVLGLNNDRVTLRDFPKIRLENGDSIHVPPVPTTVTVLGQVYNQSTFMYNRSNTVEDYINMAGTTNDFADKSSVYILHADGTLYNKQQAGWFGTFNGRKIYPGDAIIVPQNIEFMTAQQLLLNWTQIISNFGMGAASLEVFK